MARLVLCVLALFVASGLADPIKPVLHKIADKAAAERQSELLFLFFHIHEPNHIESCQTIANTWDLEKNIEHYSNVTAVKTYVDMLEHNWVLPRAVPFSIFENNHKFEAITLFNILYSAKDYTTFYKTAVYLRDRVNEGLFVYVLATAITHRPDTQGVVVPPIYEIFPSFFNNGEIMTTAQRINTHGFRMIEDFPSTYKWNDNVVIRWNSTTWPYHGPSTSIAYFTHDNALNAFYYNTYLLYPYWLGGDVIPLVKDRRGERFWFIHKQLVSRYYMERLSNGLGEIPELGHEIVEEGYNSGLLYHNGIPFPVRPNYFHLDQPAFVDELEEVTDYERRIRDAIDSGYIVNSVGEHINIRTPEAIDILGRLIEAGVDSPNVHYYKDFISIWKALLGNSVAHEHQYYHHHVPLVVPSVLEHYQTALRDPAFYIIWKRVLKMFTLWQEHLPQYKPEELALPTVAIQKVEVDKLVTYFENNFMNISSHLHMTEEESKTIEDHVSVLVQHPHLNHKVFNVRVHVKSEVTKTVAVRFFLAPKYDSHGFEIPLEINTQNFFQFDQFTYDLVAGENVITRVSTDNEYTTKDWPSAFDIYTKAQNAIHGNGQYVIGQQYPIDNFPDRLLLPKGRVGGMPFVLFVYISEHREPTVKYGTGFDPILSLGAGSGACQHTADPLGFPLDRPLHNWQVKHLHNLWFQDVLINHKHVPEIDVPHTE